MVQILWHKKAIEDLNQAFDYILEEDPKSAFMVYELIKKRIEQLKNFPEISREGRVSGTRELVILNIPYIVVYQFEDNKIKILAILHDAMKWPNNF